MAKGGTYGTVVHMNLALGAVSSSFRVGQKGRVMLPAAVRRAAHLEDGAEVVARSDGEGRIIIESVDSIRVRLWAAAPASDGLDVAQDVREMRQQDQAVVEANAARQLATLGSEADSEAAGRALLNVLGL